MKKLIPLLALLTVPAFAADLALNNLSKSDLEKVSNEIAVNFSHTAVAAPETNGLWGVEVGVVGGLTNTPKLKDLVNDAGEDGSDFKRIPHGGLMARAHFPFEIFAELSFIPTSTVSSLEFSNKTAAIGWNFGSFFGLPLDLAIGAEGSMSKLSYDQTINNSTTSNTDVDSTISFETKTRNLWIGASKTFLFVTPYIKAGLFKSDSDVKVDTNGANGTIFAFSNSQKQSVDSSGGFAAIGANVNLLFLRLGVEGSRTANVGRLTAKLSFAF